jgi:hypothetical protein
MQAISVISVRRVLIAFCTEIVYLLQPPTTNHQQSDDSSKDPSLPSTEQKHFTLILVHTPHDRQNYRERMSLRSFSSIQDEGNRKHYTNVLIDQARQHPTTPLYNSP